MQNFQKLLTEAAQLKQSQLKRDRKVFQSLPEFIKSGLGYSKKYKVLRKQDFEVQLHVALKLKKIGNEHYAKKQFKQALHKYQEGLSIFRYIESQTNENISDEDIKYLNFSPKNLEQEQPYKNIMNSVYLNICSCLTKLNCKEDAIYAADQALQIDQRNPKAHYRKAQAYFKYINRSADDIKLGFLQLKQTFDCSDQKDKPIIIEEMHKIKGQIYDQRSKQKKWFKFLFDKNKQPQSAQNQQKAQISANANVNVNPEAKKIEQGKQQIKTASDYMKLGTKAQQETSSFDQFIKQANQARKFVVNKDKKGKSVKSEDKQEKQRIQKTKQKLQKYCDMPSDIWLLCYQQEFLQKHGSKIYSIIKIYNYSDIADQYKKVFANSLQAKNKRIETDASAQKVQQTFKEKAQKMSEYFDWLRKHPIETIVKYIQRYDLQTEWIKQQRIQRAEKQKEENLQKQKSQKVPEPLVRDKRTFLKIVAVIIVLYIISKIFK